MERSHLSHVTKHMCIFKKKRGRNNVIFFNLQDLKKQTKKTLYDVSLKSYHGNKIHPTGYGNPSNILTSIMKKKLCSCDE